MRAGTIMQARVIVSIVTNVMLWAKLDLSGMFWAHIHCFNPSDGYQDKNGETS